MNEHQIEIVFWAPGFRNLSSSDIGTDCGTEREAFDQLYLRIAGSEGPVHYINDIYDEAQVELGPDNMEQITVHDHYDICPVYGKEESDLPASVRTLEMWGAPHDNAVGMMYAKREHDNDSPHFADYLEHLKKEHGG